MLIIAVDAMGGDLGPRAAFWGCKRLLGKYRQVSIKLFVEKRWVAEAAELFSDAAERIQIIGCGASVAANDKPTVVLKRRQNSSMAMALKSCRDGHSSGVLSVGSTGALMILSRRLLGVLPGIDRPALATQIPTRGKPLLLLDLGASLGATAAQLVQFAVLGVSWCRSMGTTCPEVGLLNVGHESGKGTEDIRAADTILQRLMPANYQGFYEGDDLYRGDLDVMVCDGFTGNVALKTSEGLTEWLTQMVKDELHGHWLLRLMSPALKAAFRRIHRRIAPSRHGGAMLLGIDGVVVKTHGKSDESTFEHSLGYLVKQAQNHDRESLIKQIMPMKAAIA
ncbi:phosphate acyltransferase PlsX [Oceanobacter mangrovi]|uniref:phosphate acyltransferase PlsX n=1 Tax=Oceanobacter mangrovi TaxID=2862510 RepID=UPI0024848303|nr:phosphate acyltransferase PlsX [Oceanobacter mangrovi]